VTLLYATTTSRNGLLTVKTVNISIVNTAGYTVLDIVANMIPIDVAPLALDKNASPVVSVEHMEPLTRRTMRSTYAAMIKVVMVIIILGAALISLMT
jgi:hypothetical protein